jgi:hypothetical protein
MSKQVETVQEIYINPVKLGYALGGLSQHSVHRLSSEGVLPRPEVTGQWPLLKCTNAYISHLKSSAKSSDLLSAKIELTQQQARSKQLENDALEGTLVSRADAEKAMGDLILNCRAKLLALPKKLAFELASEPNPNICLQMLEDAIYEALLELSQMGDEGD